MKKKDITALVFLSMNKKEFDEVADFFADNLILDFPGIGQVQSKRRVIISLKAILRKYKYLKFTLVDFVEEDDKVCVIWSNEGEKNSGEKYENRGITFFRFENGKVNFISDYFKDTSFVEN